MTAWVHCWIAWAGLRSRADERSWIAPRHRSSVEMWVGAALMLGMDDGENARPDVVRCRRLIIIHSIGFQKLECHVPKSRSYECLN